MSITWDPQQYGRFAAERTAPFRDLLSLVEPADFGRAVDLGCGRGELTALAVEQLGTGSMVGIDSSEDMLASAAEHVSDRLRFETGDLSVWTSDADHDLVLAAASLQWVPDHAAVLARWRAALAPRGQLAVHVPANADAPTHRVAVELAASEPYLAAFGSAGPPPDPVAANVLAPERYAALLHGLGFERQHVRLVVYPYLLSATREAVEWVKGTTLRRIQARLSADLYEQFLADYERRLVEVLGEHEPLFFPFRRILVWGRLPSA